MHICDLLEGILMKVLAHMGPSIVQVQGKEFVFSTSCVIRWVWVTPKHEEFLVEDTDSRVPTQRQLGICHNRPGFIVRVEGVKVFCKSMGLEIIASKDIHLAVRYKGHMGIARFWPDWTITICFSLNCILRTGQTTPGVLVQIICKEIIKLSLNIEFRHSLVFASKYPHSPANDDSRMIRSR
jgi:hypothetical protein